MPTVLDAQMGIANETTYNTPVTVTRFYRPANGDGLEFLVVHHLGHRELLVRVAVHEVLPDCLRQSVFKNSHDVMTSFSFAADE